MCRVIVIYCIHKLILFIMIIVLIFYITLYMYDLYLYISVHLTSALILVWPPSCGHLNWAFNFPEGIASSLGNLVWFCSAAKRGSCYLCHLLLHYCHVLCAISAAPPLRSTALQKRKPPSLGAFHFHVQFPRAAPKRAALLHLKI